MGQEESCQHYSSSVITDISTPPVCSLQDGFLQLCKFNSNGYLDIISQYTVNNRWTWLGREAWLTSLWEVAGINLSELPGPSGNLALVNCLNRTRVA